jgi:hypothetical protein
MTRRDDVQQAWDESEKDSGALIATIFQCVKTLADAVDALDKRVAALEEPSPRWTSESPR